MWPGLQNSTVLSSGKDSAQNLDAHSRAHLNTSTVTSLFSPSVLDSVAPLVKRAQALAGSRGSIGKGILFPPGGGGKRHDGKVEGQGQGSRVKGAGVKGDVQF